MSWLALDIGGANLKAADGLGFAVSREFALWQRADELAAALADLVAASPECSRLAVTMTGELADCYANKVEGVTSILESVADAAGSRDVFVYLCDGRLVRGGPPRAEALLAAASNWHALASFCGRFVGDGSGMLVDIGSTTCDLIPVDSTGVQAVGRTDPERLVTGELVYTGVVRSPLCAVVRELPWRGELCPVAQELFASMADVYTLLGDLLPAPQDCKTADGRPRTKEFAHARIARMVCADETMYSAAEALQAAEMVAAEQLRMLEAAYGKIVARLEQAPKSFIVSGQGEFVARRLVERVAPEATVISLNEQLGNEASRAAPAHALAVLARERLGE